MCCFFPQLLTCIVLINKPVWSQVQKRNLTRFFLCKYWSYATLLLSTIAHHAKSLYKISTWGTMISASLQHQWSGELFLGQMVSAGSQLPQQQMVGIKRLWVLLAPAKLKASTSVVCRLIITECVGKQNSAAFHCRLALRAPDSFWRKLLSEHLIVCSNP